MRPIVLSVKLKRKEYMKIKEAMPDIKTNRQASKSNLIYARSTNAETMHSIKRGNI